MRLDASRHGQRGLSDASGVQMERRRGKAHQQALRLSDGVQFSRTHRPEPLADLGLKAVGRTSAGVLPDKFEKLAVELVDFPANLRIRPFPGHLRAS